METMKIVIMDNADEMWEGISESLKNTADRSVEPFVLHAKEDGMRVVRQLREEKPGLLLLKLTQETQRDYHQSHGVVPYHILDEEDVASDMLDGEDTCLVMMTVQAKSLKTTLTARKRLMARPVSKSAEEIVCDLCMRMGMQPQYLGYLYTQEAVRIVLEDDSGTSRVTKDIYPGVAKRFQTTTSKVERCIRHAVEKVWENGKIEVINDALGFSHYSREARPANSNFILTMAEICRKQLQMG